MGIRWVLTDEQWAKIEPHCLGKPSNPGRSGTDNLRFVEAVLWIARTGSPGRDLPRELGDWNTVFKRFRDWVKADVFQRLSDAVSEQLDMEYALVDAAIMKLHRHGQGAKGDFGPGYRSLAGRLEHEDTGLDERVGQSGEVHPDAKAAP